MTFPVFALNESEINIVKYNPKHENKVLKNVKIKLPAQQV